MLALTADSWLMKRMSSRWLLQVLTSLWLAGQVWAAPKVIHEFDFTKPEAAQGWTGLHSVGPLQTTAEGLRVAITGEDPYFSSPALDFPARQPLWLVMRLKSSQGGFGQVFYFDRLPSEEASRPFRAGKEEWTEVRIALPPLGPRHRVRLDPPGEDGHVIIAWLRFEARPEFAPPPFSWRTPRPGTRVVVKSGALEWWENPANAWGGELRVNGRSMAFAHPQLEIGFLRDGEPVWLDIPPPKASARRGEYQLESVWQDATGANWTYRQRFKPGAQGVLEVESTLESNRDAEMLFAPMFLLAAGEGSFGTNKNQGLFAGLEYLENEPSSSEADIIGPESRRQVPSNHKITFPLMAIQHDGHYVGLSYEDHLSFSAVFDSPDRLFGSQGHALGVIWPESDGRNRIEGSLAPQFTRTLKAGQPVRLRARIFGGVADTIIPAVQKYVQLIGLPAVAKDYLSLSAYVELAAQGWLRSKVREGNKYRHAVWPGFNAQHAADAAVYETWLAARATPPWSDELTRAAAEAIAPINPAQYYHSTVSHVRTPAAPLVFGGIRESVAAARGIAQSSLQRLGAEKILRYHAAGGRPDYGRTHWENHANGLTAPVLADALRAAAFCGDRELIEQALAALRAQERYRNGVPRGAQTWEIPLHTPDILASAHLVNAFVLGYELTGERQFLDEAVYWAWTGVPFVYLVNPTGKPVGVYSTIAVLGATNWKAPVWFGQPVQWCGLVYADALYRLAKVQEQGGLWRQLADGITVAGLQHTWKQEDKDRVGLLPDFFLLHPQRSEGPAINPGTVGANAAQLYTQIPLYDFLRLRQAGINVHAPGLLQPVKETAQGGAFAVRGWLEESYYVLITGLSARPEIRINGRTTSLQAPHEYEAAGGWLALKVSGHPRIEVILP